MIDNATLLRASDRELERILALPEKREEGAFLRARMTMLDHALRKAPGAPGAPGAPALPPSGGGLRLWDDQLRSLLELDPANPRGGYFGQQGVGSGKAAISFLLASRIAEYNARTRSQRTGGSNEITIEDWPVTILLVPSDMHLRGRGQTFERYKAWSRHYHLAPLRSVPGRVGARPPKGTYIVSHGQLSAQRGTDIFQRIQPDLVVVDEAHRLAGDSARARRWLRWFVDPDEGAEAFGVTPRLAVMSGTLWKRSLTDFDAMLECALMDACPLPVNAGRFMVDNLLSLWGAMLDAHGEPDQVARAAMSPLLRWHELREQGAEPPLARLGARAIMTHPDRYKVDKDGEWCGYIAPGVVLSRTWIPSALRRQTDTHRSVMPKARKAFEYRLSTLHGVRVTSSASCDARLVLEEVKEPQQFSKQLQALESTWKLPPTEAQPEGEEILEAKDFVRHRAMLVWGVVRVWDWRSTDHSDGDKDWLDARRAWSAAVAAFKRNHAKTGLDSDGLIQAAAAAGELGADMQYVWNAWAGVKDRYWSRCPITGQRQNQPPGVIEFLDYDKTVAALDEQITSWRRARGDRGLIWYSTPIFERPLRSLGFNVFGAGTAAPPDAVDLPCCSIRVHGTGKNLQGEQGRDGGRGAGGARGGLARGWSENLLLQPPRHYDSIEQLIGRTHRPGQGADEVGLRTVGALLRQVWREAEAMPGGKARLLLADRLCRTERSYSPEDDVETLATP